MASSTEPTEVIVHPIVLLSVVDHYNRVAKDTRKRVVGCLVGKVSKGVVDVTNSFAVPFEEDPRDESIWYLDHNYLETMFSMFKKVNVKERIVGFYSSAPVIRAADIEIDRLFRKYTSSPVLVVVDVRPHIEGLPVKSYTSVETVIEGKETRREFKHVASAIGAEEVEEIGVEHLLRDVNDPSVTKLGDEMRHKLLALKSMTEKLQEILEYLTHVLGGRIQPNHQIMYNIQEILNLLPNLNVEAMTKAVYINANDMHLALYLSSMVRSVLALHDLVTNKLKYKDQEEKADAEGDTKDAKAKGGDKDKGKDKGDADDKTKDKADGSTPAKKS